MYAVNIYVFRGKAYLPIQAKFRSGIWLDVEPVFTSNLSVDELTLTINKVISDGHKILPNPTLDEWKKRKDPILSTTKARSWKALAKNGVSYSIHQKNEKIRVDMSYTDEKGRWQNDPKKVRFFSKDTPLQEIVKILLSDIQSRSEVI